MTLNVGVRVNVVEKFVDGWWKVIVESQENDTQQTSPIMGLYPSNYLQEESHSANNSAIKNVIKQIFLMTLFHFIT